MQTFIKPNSSPKFHDAVKAGGVPNKAVSNILRAGVQPKLRIGAVNDPAEIEADRVADQVMRMPAAVNEGPNVSTKINPNDINRKCTDCGDKEKIQRKETPDIRMKETGGAGGHTASAEASSAINSLGSGSPLVASERAFFEPRFGQDLSHIRVHTGGTADAASQSINARAFSLGNNIAFANGEYQPGTQSGRTLMAHEITHTLQGGGTIRRVRRSDCAKDKECDVQDGMGKKSGEFSITIYADKEGPLLMIPLTSNVGHSWFKLEDDTGKYWTYGFWPAVGFNPSQPKKDVDGCVHHPDTSHKPTASKKIVLTASEFAAAHNYAKSVCKKQPNYNLSLIHI